MTQAPISLKNRILVITGGSRGIGRAIALRAAREGARIAILAKTREPHPVLPGTIDSVAAEIRSLGAEALPIAVDVRDADAVESAIARVAAEWGGIDILVNNASAISLTGTKDTPAKRFDLLWSVNVRGTYVTTRAALAHLARSENPHILTLSPPPTLDPLWYGGHLAYTLSKMGMSLCVLGWSRELAPMGIAVNALWPKTVIATQALTMLGGAVKPGNCRTPEIVADAAIEILKRPAAESSGRFFIDEEVLTGAGIRDFTPYAVDPAQPLYPDLFLDRDAKNGTFTVK
ncbi:short-chain dehydrogenase/reductase SDR [mine drainage metagenome]|uniref:Short-chain dehydrogenase/reductase SDR n=2 Tax=mine drainage metagenome TaxID=410659 RepID=T1BZ83_9ZZZZ